MRQNTAQVDGGDTFPVLIWSTGSYAGLPRTCKTSKDWSKSSKGPKILKSGRSKTRGNGHRKKYKKFHLNIREMQVGGGGGVGSVTGGKWFSFLPCKTGLWDILPSLHPRRYSKSNRTQPSAIHRSSPCLGRKFRLDDLLRYLCTTLELSDTENIISG